MDLARNGDADELLKAQAHIWNHMVKFVDSMSLKCAIQLGIPDTIHKHGQPMTLSQLIRALSINDAKAPFIYRLMQILIHSGFVVKAKITENNEEEEEGEGYILTSASKLLLKNDPLSMRPLLLCHFDPILTDPCQHFSQWFQNDDETPFKTCHGMAFWELADHEPQFNRFFNEGMASDARLTGFVLIKKCKNVFAGLNSLVDVGGGTGNLAKTIADAFPHMNCIVLDVPRVVDGLVDGDYKNLTYVGGDMFKAIPPADAVLMKWVLHDWNDEECIQILENCKKAIPSQKKGGKLIIIDMVVNDEQQKGGGDDRETIETKLLNDVQQMAHLKGRERSEKDLAKLFSKAGFDDYNISSALGLRSLIEAYYY